MRAPHTVGACKLESACTGAGLYRRWVPAPEMPRAKFLRLRTAVGQYRGTGRMYHMFIVFTW